MIFQSSISSTLKSIKYGKKFRKIWEKTYYSEELPETEYLNFGCTRVEPSLFYFWLTVGGVRGGGTFGDNGGGSPGKASAVETNPGGKFAMWVGVTFAALIGWIIGTGRRLLTIAAAPAIFVGDSTLKLGLKKCLSGTLGATGNIKAKHMYWKLLHI